MKTIKIMTDSASDIHPDIEKELDIKILSFPITVDDVGYLERVDFTNHEFYEILEECTKIPTTAQITSFQYVEEFTEVYKTGFEHLIVVTINSKGSNTYNSCVMAKEQFFEENPDAVGKFDVHIFDGKSYSLGYGYPVIEAAKKIVNGANTEDVLFFLDDFLNKSVVYFSPLKLNFAKKSGRISVVAAFVGELMGIRPIIKIQNCEMQIIEKVRGDKALYTSLCKLAKQHMIPDTPVHILTGKNPTELEIFETMMKQQLGSNYGGTCDIGAAISINAGPQLIGFRLKANIEEEEDT